MQSLSDGLIRQIKSIEIIPDKPLLITDADEVLLNFVSCFQEYLKKNNLWYDLSSYSLFGNIKDHSNNAIENTQVSFHLENFFKTNARVITFAKDSIKYIKLLIEKLNFQIIVLTNIPYKYLEDRRICFKNNGLDLPMIAGSGPKGKIIKELISNHKDKNFFIDDLAPHIISSKDHADQVKTIHYISNKELSKLAITPDQADIRANSWKEIYTYIENEINR